jgi:hypothetical protein
MGGGEGRVPLAYLGVADARGVAVLEECAALEHARVPQLQHRVRHVEDAHLVRVRVRVRVVRVRVRVRVRVTVRVSGSQGLRVRVRARLGVRVSKTATSIW